LTHQPLTANLERKTVTPNQLETWRSQILETLFVSDPLPPLQPEFHGSFKPCAGVRLERITYGTQFGLEIPAILYLPDPPMQEIPGLIVINGHGGDKYSWYSFYTGVLYARAGVAVLTYDPIGEGERNINRLSGTRAHDKLERIPELACRLTGLMVIDVMQAVTYLCQRPDVDSGRIAAAGHSMGSYILSLAGAVEQRINSSVLVGGGNLDGPGGYWDNSKPMCQGLSYQSLQYLGDRPAVIYTMHAFRGPTLIFNGLEDAVVAIPTHAQDFFGDLKRRTIALKGSPENVFDARFVPNVSHRPFFVTRPVAQWLEEKLDLPNWSDQDIQTMPDTLISDWARAQNVAMDPPYATPERSGGTKALGSGVPGLTREQLSVFDVGDWEKQKGTLVLESWVESAREDLEKR
jgi:dienelactone hydrolase